METSNLRIILGGMADEDPKTRMNVKFRFLESNILEERQDLVALFGDAPVPEDFLVVSFDVHEEYCESLAEVLNSKIINLEPSVLLPEIFLSGHEERKYQIFFLHNPATPKKLYMLVIPETASSYITAMKDHLKYIMGDLSQESYAELYFESNGTIEDFTKKEKTSALFNNTVFNLKITNDKKIGNLLNAIGKRLPEESKLISHLLKSLHTLMNSLDEFNIDIKLKNSEDLPEDLRAAWESEQNIVGVMEGIKNFVNEITEDKKAETKAFLSKYLSSGEISSAIIMQGLGIVEVNVKFTDLIQ